MSYILNRKKDSPNKRILNLVLFVSIVFIVGLAFTVSTWEPNYFEILGVPRSATAKDIKQAYRKLSLDLHPDKNPTKEAEELFLLASKAQTTLLNDEFRDAYDRWGEEGLKWIEHSQNMYLNGLVRIGIFVLSHFVMVFILTISVSSTNARSYSFGFLGFIVVILANLRFGEDDLLIPFNPSMTKDQKCNLISSSMGLVVTMICAIQRFFYYDFEEKIFKLLSEIKTNQDAVLGNHQPQQILKQGQKKSSTLIQPSGEQQQLPAPRRSFLPELPSWAYILLFLYFSQYLGGGNNKH